MRQMTAHPSDGPPERFCCTECGWVFQVPRSLTSDIPPELQRKFAEQWYDVHQCFDFPARPES